MAFNISVATSQKTQFINITEIEMLREIISVCSEIARKLTSKVCVCVCVCQVKVGIFNVELKIRLTSYRV